MVTEIPTAREYTNTLISDVENLKKAAIAGDRRKEVDDLVKNAKDVKDGAYNLKSNAKLYELAAHVAPDKLNELAIDIARGAKKFPENVSKLMGEFNVNVREATNQPM